MPLSFLLALVLMGARVAWANKTYTTKDGQRLHVVPPSASLMEHISSLVGPQMAQLFNSTGRKLKSFKRKESAALQWRLVAEQWIRALNSVPAANATLAEAFTQAAIPRRPTTVSTLAQADELQRPLLCVHFASADSPSVFDNIRSNVLATKAWCDWALVFYAGSEYAIREFEKSVNAAAASGAAAATGGRIVLATRYVPPGQEQVAGASSAAGSAASPYTPKPLMYRALLPLLPRYKRAWLLDSDISLASFPLQRFFALLACASGASPAHPVLIAQPVIQQDTQDFPLFNLGSWTAAAASAPAPVLAIRYDTVEQQAPLFDAAFLAWFTRHLIEPHRPLFLRLGSDWGLDDVWCRAAREYWHFGATGARPAARSWQDDERLGVPPQCAIAVATPISHLGRENVTGSGIGLKHSAAQLARWRFSFGGFLLNKFFAARFPEWVKTESAVKETVAGVLAQAKRYPRVTECKSAGA